MKITALPKIYRNTARFTEIITIASKYGLADWIKRLKLDFVDEWLTDQRGEDLREASQPKRIRLLLTELGPTFIKLGQVLSTRPDLLGEDYASELKLLQSNVPADPPESVRRCVEDELGASLEERFKEFDTNALASASIGQVHVAQLHTGESVVVKVQHEGIIPKIEEDLDILATLAELAARIPEFAIYQPIATIEEFRRSLSREIDFTWELRNLQMFARLFEENPKAKIPTVYPDYSTPHVMTMERLQGRPLKAPEELAKDGYDLAAIAKTGAEIFLQMIFTHGVFHADPHPGNFYIMPENVVGLIDFGMVARLSDTLREDIEDMLMSIAQRDADALTTAIVRMGSIPPNADLSGLNGDIQDFISFYGTLPLNELDVGAVFNEMMGIVRRYRITLPGQIGMLIKVLVSLEGTSRLLNPDFSLMEVLRPIQQEIILRRLSPERHLKKMRRRMDELNRLLELLPPQLLAILQQIRNGAFTVPLDHRGLETSINRIVLGMITSALLMGSSLMLSFKVPPLMSWLPTKFGLDQLSLFGLGGLALSFLFSMRLLRAIGKSGNFDDRQKPF